MLKNKVLRAIEIARGSYLSGQQLADACGVSRAAVNKAIAQLRNDGYPICAVTNKGYRLEKSSDVLSKEGIDVCIANRCTYGNITLLGTVDSTNTYAKKLSMENACHGDIVIADSQSAGRGRLGRSFYSPPGEGLYMSFILKPGISLAESAFYTVCAAVAVSDAVIDLTGCDCKIKWVNDIFVNGKKICGILTEAVADFESATAESVIVGMGVNVSTKNFPDSIKNTAASIGKNAPVRNALAAEIIVRMMNITENLDKKEVVRRYKELSLMLERDISYTLNGEACKGHVLDINQDGNLVVENASNEVVTLKSGEVSIGSENI